MTLLVVTAAETRDEALTLAKHLEGKRLGTAQIVETTCVFWHDWQMGTGSEWRIELATISTRLAELASELLAQSAVRSDRRGAQNGAA